MSDLGRLSTLLAERLRAGEHLLLLTDYDGTLSPIVADPGEARLPDDARRALEALAGMPGVHVAIVSGRQLDDLRARVGVGGLIYAGCHGLEIDGPGIRFQHTDAAARRETMERLAATLRAALAEVPGVLVEPKGLSVAVHYRRVPSRLVPRVEAEVERAITTAPGTHVLRGKFVMELLPTASWHKGRCAQRILRHVRSQVSAPVTALYMGDDTTDELAFWALDGQAITVRVGAEAASFATHRLRGTAEVQRLLAGLATTLAARTSP